MPTALDDRTFESAVELTPEQQAANVQHFKDKGYDVEVENEGDGIDDKSKTAKPEETAPAAEATPAGNTAEEPESGEAELDATAEQERLDAQAEQNGGDKQHLGWRAKKTQQIRELQEKLNTTTAEKDGRIEELRRQLAERDARLAAANGSASPKSDISPVSEQPKKEEPKPEPIKAKEFDKPRPTRPTLADFKDSDDPYAALAEANGEFAEKLSDWKDEKRTFDEQQKAEVARQEQEREQARTRETSQEQEIRDRWEAARKARPDYDTVVNDNVVFTPVLRYLIKERLNDGFALAYELAKPENAEFYNELMESSKTTVDEDQSSINAKIDAAMLDLGYFRRSLKSRAAAPAAEPVKAAPAATAPEPVKQTPPATPPRREEAAPTPVRGRGALADRLEDIPLEDSDARRAWKKAHGQM